MESVTQDARRVLSRIDAASGRAGRRLVVGIAGPPGSGKSTLAAQVVALLNAGQPHRAVLVPMDGFHLDNSELDRLGLRAVKGAPQTFDAAGFVTLLNRARVAGTTPHYPVFDRVQDRSVPAAAVIPAQAEIIVAEGNYLLLSSGDWAGLRPLLDLCVMLRPSLATLEERLLDRWRSLGLDEQAIQARTYGNDLPNARLVLRDSLQADLYLAEDGGDTAH